MVRREAQRHITMFGFGTKIGESAIVFASKNTALRHTIDTCWALHEVPDWEKERRHLKREQLDSEAHVTVAPTSVVDITTRHNHLATTPPPTLTAVSSIPTPSPPSNFGKAFHAYDTRDIGWIIDLGATDNMTYNSALFSTILPPHRDHVLIANNAAALVAGSGSVLLTPTLPLDKVISRLGEIFGRDTKKGGFIMWMMWQLIGFFVLVAPKLLSIAGFGGYITDLGVLRETTCPQTQQNVVAEHKNEQIFVAARALLLGVLVLKRCLVVSSMFTSIRIKGVSWTNVLFAVSIWDEVFFSDTPEHVLQGETSSERHNWLDLLGGVVLDSLIQREEPTEPVEPATPAELATLVELAILTDVTTVTEPIAPYEAFLIVPDQAPLDIREHLDNRGVPPDRYSPEGKARYAIAHYVSDHRLSPQYKVFVTIMDSIKISTRVEEAFYDPKWAEAINIEIEVLQKNNTWDIVDLSKGTKLVGYR
ncbi:unnamed protein product [Prunus armeniaca]